jgi:hypothetical protein
MIGEAAGRAYWEGAEDVRKLVSNLDKACPPSRSPAFLKRNGVGRRSNVRRIES